VDHLLIYTERALKDLAEIIGVITRDDGEAAARFGSALLDHVELLGRFPLMGRAIQSGSPVRKLVHSPILVYYQIHNDKRLVEVLHFRHGSRKPPAF
jgi:plasmid stabilization system protein ParE